jgi:hypothetical protein
MHTSNKDVQEAGTTRDSTHSFVRAALGHKKPVGQQLNELDSVAKAVQLQLTQNLAAERSFRGFLTALLSSTGVGFHCLLVGLVSQLVQEELPAVHFRKSFFDDATDRLLVRVWKKWEVVVDAKNRPKFLNGT